MRRYSTDWLSFSGAVGWGTFPLGFLPYQLGDMQPGPFLLPCEPLLQLINFKFNSSGTGESWVEIPQMSGTTTERMSQARPNRLLPKPRWVRSWENWNWLDRILVESHSTTLSPKSQCNMQLSEGHSHIMSMPSLCASAKKLRKKPSKPFDHLHQVLKTGRQARYQLIWGYHHHRYYSMLIDMPTINVITSS